jgi:uncharacterized membrane protein
MRIALYRLSGRLGPGIEGSTEMISTERNLEEARGRKSLDRLIGLSDDIFAFAITLLALDLVTPVIIGQATDAALANALANEFHSFVGFFASFWVISLLWLSHHRIFRYIKSSDGGLLILNLVLLFFVVLVPFATRVFNYGFLPTALLVYALIQIGAFIMNSIIWKYAIAPKRHLLDERVSHKTTRWLLIRGFLVSAIFAGSIPLGYVSPYLSLGAWFAVFPIVIVLDRRYTKHDQSKVPIDMKLDVSGF